MLFIPELFLCSHNVKCFKLSKQEFIEYGRVPLTLKYPIKSAVMPPRISEILILCLFRYEANSEKIGRGE
jgi:hypothetical protein